MMWKWICKNVAISKIKTGQIAILYSNWSALMKLLHRAAQNNNIKNLISEAFFSWSVMDLKEILILSLKIKIIIIEINTTMGRPKIASIFFTPTKIGEYISGTDRDLKIGYLRI